ncbi:hypothetical protein CSC94_12240 [Zhengella mangrovi]|uniref:Uncharacterized protein n=1 Tax=Zhengella mangrovi TaxID=1982044 RepID=A0A2G1QMW5_9HYPH|nr:hypothetical protein [Zhengella mangrovi]PHP66865.1 hypothetical protein CSC94_12240 [Zhengella mangrovi]
MRKFVLGLAVAAALGGAVAAIPPVMAAEEAMAAVSEAQPGEFVQVPLTSASVDHFLATWPRVSAVFTELDEQYEPGDPDTVMDELIYLSENAAAVSKLEQKVRDAGFSGFQDWLATAQSVMMARQWIIDPPNAEDMDAAEAEIRAMTDINDEVRAELLASLADARGQIDRMRPTDENLEAVRPYLARLETALGAN